ncbi:MAG: hypothetical protein VW985_10465 [Gammaproteobacteria bacterium]
MINLLVALPAEARPLIHHFKLNGLPAVAGFRRYGNDQITLLITGVGPVAMASGVTVLGMQAAPSNDAWINLGVAGHRSLPLGSSLLATKITDAGSGLCWYPPQVVAAEIERGELLTLARPAQQYPAVAAVEMEASGFYSTACRFASGELVQCLKVISDNRQQPVEQLDEELISRRMVELIEPLNRLIEALGTLLESRPAEVEVASERRAYLQAWRFSHAQEIQLDRLLTDCRLLEGAVPPVSEFSQQTTAKSLLAALAARLQTLRLNYSLSKS